MMRRHGHHASQTVLDAERVEHGPRDAASTGALGGVAVSPMALADVGALGGVAVSTGAHAGSLND